jgi:electron transport complex protein RnfB
MLYTAALFLMIMIMMRTGKLARLESARIPSIAVFKCAGSTDRKFNFINIKDCRSALSAFGSNNYCGSGCLGLGSCIRACPAGAIAGNLQIINEKCSGCGVCLDACPSGIIELVDVDKAVYVACSREADTNGENVVCVNSCTGCRVCAGICVNDAISYDNGGVPRIDLSLCEACGRCAAKCPSGVIKDLKFARHV